MSSVHRGKILRNAIENSGVTITSLVKKINDRFKGMKCSRTKLYHLFKNEYVDDGLMLAVGRVIYHDFSQEVPDLAQGSNVFLHGHDAGNDEYKNKQNQELFSVRKDLAKLQRAYIDLLSFLTKIANQNNDTELKNAIRQFLDKGEK